MTLPGFIPVYTSVTVPCRHRIGCPCPGCPHCGVGARIDSRGLRSGVGHTYGIRLESSVQVVDERAFPVVFRGW